MQAFLDEFLGRSRRQVWGRLWLAILSLAHIGIAIELLHRSVTELLQPISGWDLLWCTIAGLALLVNCGFLFGFVLLPSKSTLQSRRSAAINRLYREIRSLMESSTDPESDREIQVRFAELRRLQEEEADEVERRLESRLHLKPGEGWKALQRAEDLLARYEDSAPRNPTARHSH
jgi:hypothetical protein